MLIKNTNYKNPKISKIVIDVDFTKYKVEY